MCEKEMPELLKGKATICIPNYKTLDLTKICLRSIRKFTHYPCEVIVVDNNSKDQSLEYLRGLEWIRLIERPEIGPEVVGSPAEGSALDVGLEACNTEFFVVMHSDTFVRKANWLTELIGYFDGDDRVCCVGSGKLENKPYWQVMLHDITDVRTFKRKLFREPDPFGRYRRYNLTICCVYKTAVVKRQRLSFLPDVEKRLTAGKPLYLALVDRGYKTVELSSAVMSQYVIHLGHATQAVNPAEFRLRSKTMRKCSRTIRKVLSSELFHNVLHDESLDRAAV
jgi:glycosyltransferase involved in cell wall biosynthesis